MTEIMVDNSCSNPILIIINPLIATLGRVMPHAHYPQYMIQTCINLVLI